MGCCLLVPQIVVFVQILAAYVDAVGVVVFMVGDVETVSVLVEHTPVWKCEPHASCNPSHILFSCPVYQEFVMLFEDRF